MLKNSKDSIRDIIIQTLDSKKSLPAQSLTHKDIVKILDREVGVEAEEENNCILYDTSNGLSVEQIKLLLEDGSRLTVSVSSLSNEIRNIDCYFED
jgi:MinD-like ATPase involved in chromosome partitioning or flagellar assembly